MRIRELAGITTPESRMIMITPWDAYDPARHRKSDSEEQPRHQPGGSMAKSIRIVLPELSTERRQEFVKIVTQNGRRRPRRYSPRAARRDGALKKEAKARRPHRRRG